MSSVNCVTTPNGSASHWAGLGGAGTGARNGTIAHAHYGQYHFTLTGHTSGHSFSLWEPCAANTCLSTSAEVISSAPSDASDGQPTSALPLADYAAANFEAATITGNSGHTGGFLSTAWPTFGQATPKQPITGPILATPSRLYGGQAYTNTWRHAS